MRIKDEEDSGPPVIEVDGGAGTTGKPPDASPHAVLGVSPAHGPASGGTLALIRGNGFASDARVWFGDVELESDSVVAVDAERIQVTVPPGDAGAVDLVVQNGDDESTRGVLRGGYTYDRFHADPPNGPTAGGTLIRLLGEDTGWTKSTKVEIDQNPCEIQEFVGPTELTCRVPPGTAGAKPVRTVTGDETIDVLDAFAYVNSDNGNRGGISGDALDQNLSVLVFDDYTGEAIDGASVIVGADLDLVAETNGDGVAVISDSSLEGKATVTIAKHCFQPMTFVDVPAERLTVYLEPVLSASCGAGGGIPGGGGTPGRASSIDGELVAGHRRVQARRLDQRAGRGERERRVRGVRLPARIEPDRALLLAERFQRGHAALRGQRGVRVQYDDGLGQLHDLRPGRPARRLQVPAQVHRLRHRCPRKVSRSRLARPARTSSSTWTSPWSTLSRST